MVTAASRYQLSLGITNLYVNAIVPESGQARSPVVNDWFDGRKQLGRSHHAHRHAGPAKDRFDHFNMVCSAETECRL